MSDGNPYESTLVSKPATTVNVRKISIKPIEHLKRGYALIRENYGQFFCITLVAMLIGSLVPMGLIMGPMMVGIYLCFIELEQKGQTEVSSLFRGFDQFADALIAYLVLMALSMLVIIPVMIVFFAIVFIPIIQSANNGTEPDFPWMLFAMYPVIMILNLLVMCPFIFTFQLIADKKMKGMDAVKASFKGVKTNFVGVLCYLFVLSFVTLLAALCCYIPAFLLMPISFASMFVLYRDVYGAGTEAIPVAKRI